MGLFWQFISTRFGTVSSLSMFTIIQPLFLHCKPIPGFSLWSFYHKEKLLSLSNLVRFSMKKTNSFGGLVSLLHELWVHYFSVWQLLKFRNSTRPVAVGFPTFFLSFHKQFFVKLILVIWGRNFVWWGNCLIKMKSKVKGILALCEFHYCEFSYYDILLYVI